MQYVYSSIWIFSTIQALCFKLKPYFEFYLGNFNWVNTHLDIQGLSNSYKTFNEGN